MRYLSAAVAALTLLALAACSPTPTPTPAPTVTVAVTAAPTPAPTVTVYATPTAAAAGSTSDERLAALRTISQQVTGVEETEPGRWVVHTSIVDPRGDDGTSPEAIAALSICQKAVNLGATKVTVTESDDSTFALYGHPSYGNVCTIP